ncbi:hypothetical protein PIB30_109790, partial [Stylosanthes scabra]|nr:hypothetical protein [Stylosanthes scabra]
MTRGDRGAGGRGTRGRRGRPRKMTSVPLDLGEAEAETSAPATTSTPVVPTPSLAEVGIRYARARPRSAGSLRITIGGLCPSSAWHRITRFGFGGTVGG